MSVENNGGVTGKGFTPGKSGNPGGRKPMPPELKKAFQDHSQEALDTLVEIMRNGEEPNRLRASDAILDRAWGKPVQQVEADVHDTRATVDTSKLTPDQKDALAALAVSSLEG